MFRILVPTNIFSCIDVCIYYILMVNFLKQNLNVGIEFYELDFEPLVIFDHMYFV